MHQDIRFRAAPDGTRLAYAVHGSGPPIVKAANWLTHLEYDWESPVWRHWLRALGERNTLVRYDERGCGLSDRELTAMSHDVWVEDLATVIDAAGCERCTLLGISQGAAIAVGYAVQHPERVSSIVLYGGYARGRAQRDDAQLSRHGAHIAAIRAGWEDPDPTFRHLFSTQYLPDGSREQHEWYDELQRRSTSAETAARLYEERSRLDVTSIAPRVQAPTLVLHARGDRVVPFEEGRLLATLIPDAHLVPLESDNHVLLEDEPAWTHFLDELHAFVPGAAPVRDAPTEDLSAREVEVLELVADGLSNEEIADRLVLSVRTVERHLSNVYVKLRVSGKSARAAAAAWRSRRPA